MAKPSLPQGTRDFDAITVKKRQYIFETIRHAFERYGFQPIETPAMENLETLMGKYGEEGDQLIFKVLNNGLERPEKKQKALADFEKILEGKNVSGLTERALRYDLTIPFARYVAMNHGKLTFPFKRYQMQPVWRADKPQRGRYREFYQCDADVVGSSSLFCETEFACLYAQVFTQLGVSAAIKINSRKLLAALAIHSGGLEKMTAITVAIDKLDKIGIEKVKDELSERGIEDPAIAAISSYLAIEGSNNEMLAQASLLLGHIPLGDEGISDLQRILQAVPKNVPISVDFTLARGLNYYTGAIFEVKANGVNMGSIGGGGRYDDLTGLFDVPNIAGVGISFGVDRIYDVMEELNLFPTTLSFSTEVLFFNMGEKESQQAFELMMQLRAKGIRCEMYHEAVKLDKQFKYAEKKGIRQVVILGNNELAAQTCTIKHLVKGSQVAVSWPELANAIDRM